MWRTPYQNVRVAPQKRKAVCSVLRLFAVSAEQDHVACSSSHADEWWSRHIPRVDVLEPQRRQVHRGYTAHGIDKFFQFVHSVFPTHLLWVWLWFRSFFSCFMQGVLGELSPQKPNFGDKIQCLQRFADLFLPPSFHIFVINKPYRKRRFCPAGFLNFCKTKKPLHTCGKKNGHKDSYAVPKFLARSQICNGFQRKQLWKICYWIVFETRCEPDLSGR